MSVSGGKVQRGYGGVLQEGHPGCCGALLRPFCRLNWVSTWQCVTAASVGVFHKSFLLICFNRNWFSCWKLVFISLDPGGNAPKQAGWESV